MLVPTIGIEIHVELKSKEKVFSLSKNNYNDLPNTNVNVIDLGYPGTLPKLNKEVVEMALMAAIAFNCKINKKMHFDRKNYFYPDLPKGYQITQNKTPIGYDGYVEIEINNTKKKIGIERIHIEEDTCKSIHKNDNTYLNFNRAGVPLIEIVSKPVIADEKEAIAYLEKIRETLLYLGISDVKIEEGSMRCDANVSLKEENAIALGTKTEIKNIGSISNVGTSILYEIKRQKEMLEKGLKITEETRRFDEKTGTTVLMRTKETGNDYRYFPEPDIPFITLDDKLINKIKNNLPMLPDDLRIKYKSLGLNDNHIKTIIGNVDLNNFYSSIIDKTNPVIGANILTGDILNYLNKNNLSINNIKLDKNNFIELINLLEQEKISSKQTKDIIPILLSTNENVKDIVKKYGFELISDEKDILPIINKVLDDNYESVISYKQGKNNAFQYLIGQIMKANNKVNPKVLNQLLIKVLNDK